MDYGSLLFNTAQQAQQKPLVAPQVTPATVAQGSLQQKTTPVQSPYLTRGGMARPATPATPAVPTVAPATPVTPNTAPKGPVWDDGAYSAAMEGWGQQQGPVDYSQDQSGVRTGPRDMTWKGPPGAMLAGMKSGDTTVNGELQLQLAKQFDPNAYLIPEDGFGTPARLVFDESKMPKQQRPGWVQYQQNARDLQLRDPSQVYDDPIYGRMTTPNNAHYKGTDPDWMSIAGPALVMALSGIGAGGIPALFGGAGAGGNAIGTAGVNALGLVRNAASGQGVNPMSVASAAMPFIRGGA